MTFSPLLPFFCLLSSAIALSPTLSAAAPLSFQDAYPAALKRSELISSQLELIEQADEHQKQAQGAILPSVSGVGNFLYQPETAKSGPSYQPLIRLTANQPLFRGFREFAAVRQSGLLGQAQLAAKRQAELQLRNDLAQSFYSVLSFERDLLNLTNEMQLFEKRISELKGLARIGRSRPSEILSVDASLSTLQALREQVRGQLKTARDSLNFLTGLPAETQLMDLAEEIPSATPLPVDTYLSRIDDRPDVRAARARSAAADEGISVARGAHLPSADLTGDYYLSRTGTNDGVNWDIQLGVVIPIYSGGTIQSKVREAASQSRDSELTVSRTRRLAEQEIRTIHSSLLSDREQILAFGRAKDQNKDNYAAQTRDYRLGLVTNIDVLQAMISFQESERAYDRSRYVLAIDQVRLEVATSH